MHTPSLGRRIVAAGTAMVAVLGLSLDALLFFSLRSTLNAGIDRDLGRDAALVASEALRAGQADLPSRLAELGVRATIREPDGSLAARQPTLEPLDGAVSVRTVELPGGRKAEVAISRARADKDLRRLLRLELVITPLVVLLANLLLRLVAEIALRPLDRISEAANRTAQGHRGERLRPHPTDSRLGQMALAYDEMLDALETAVVRAQAAQTESQLLVERNRRILETAREAYVAVDDAGLIVDWNAEAERTFGWRREEVLGRPVVGTVVPDSESAAHGFERSRGTGGRGDGLVEVTAVHRDGRRFAARMAVWSTDYHGTSTTSAFIWDITEANAYASALARLAAIVESTDAAMLSTDLDGTILTWNAGAERMYGYEAAEAIGRSLDLIVPIEGRAQVEQSLSAVRSGAAMHRVEAVRQCRNGELMEVALTISPVRDANGVVYAASSIARDITEERWMADQLNQTLAALEASLDEAREAEAASRRFLDDAAHQLRTPITNIRACAEALLGAGAAERDELLGAVVRETQRAGRLMSGLLRMAQLNQNHELVRAPCDLVALCRDEADRVAARAPHLKLTVEAPGLTPVGQPLLDPHAVAEILSNLLDNARRHASARIDLTVEREDGWVEVEVVDDGPGGPDLAGAAFERFVSLDGKGGSGLGLPIARELARAHGGDLFYMDKAFVLRLPAGDEPAPGPGVITDEK